MKLSTKVVSLSVLALLVVSGMVANQAQSGDQKEAYKVGQAIQPFQLKDAVSGQEHDLGKVLGEKIVVLDFWSCQCPVSRGFEDQLKGLAEKYGEKGVAFYVIDSNTINDEAKIAAYAKEAKLNYPVLKDWKNVIADQFGAAVTPEVFVIGKDKTIVYHGAISDNQDASKVKDHFLAQALDALIAGQDVKVKENKAFGCGIKRAE